jgi:hypothetical protein
LHARVTFAQQIICSSAAFADDACRSRNRVTVRDVTVVHSPTRNPSRNPWHVASMRSSHAH